jgi:hypothetical protein
MTETSGAAAVQIAAIVAEIESLHKGRGVQVSDLDRHLGPYLSELAGPDADNRRQNLVVALNGCAALLPADMRLAVTASLALAGRPREMPYLRQRVDWLGEQIDREYRTALRRVGAAERMLAETVAAELRERQGQLTTAVNGWYLAELRSVLRLDTPSPEAQDIRRIVCTRDGLREVKAWLDVPGGPSQPGPRITSEVLFGGRLIWRKQPGGSSFQFFVELPAPLEVGQEYEYGLVTRVPEGAVMRSHYLVVPEVRCDAFDLRVRFGPDRLPGWVRRVAGETVRKFDNARPTTELLEPDPTGEVHVRFTNLTMYLGYGVQWQP